MGWLFTTPGGHKTATSYLDNQCTWERTDEGAGEIYGLRVLKSACPGNRVYYAAVEQYRAGKVTSTFAIVCKVKWNPREKDGLVMGYKDMDETCGPNEADCPLDILKLLGPTDHPYALQWRRRCLMRHLRRTARPKLEHGLKVRFASALRFTEGYEGTDFVIHKQGRKLMLGLPGSSRPSYRCSNLADRPFEILRETRVMSARL